MHERKKADSAKKTAQPAAITHSRSGCYFFAKNANCIKNRYAISTVRMPTAAECGYSYMEIVIALTIFCLLAVPIFPILMQARKNSDYVVRQYQAQAYADALAAQAVSADGTALSLLADAFSDTPGIVACHIAIYPSTSGAVPIVFSAGVAPVDFPAPLAVTYRFDFAQDEAAFPIRTLVATVWTDDGTMAYAVRIRP